MAANRQAQRILGLVVILLMAGCASTQKSMLVPYDLYLSVDAAVNPNQQGQASPILVGLYELGSDNQFLNLDFPSVQDRPRPSLGDDLISVDQIILQPGERRVIHRAGNASARHLGVVAGYRKLDGHLWRLSIPLPGTKSTNLYKFWQISPRRMSIHIDIGRQGLAVRQRR